MKKFFRKLFGYKRCDLCKRWKNPDKFHGMGWVTRQNIPEKEHEVQKALGVIIDMCYDCSSSKIGIEELQKW